MSANATIPMAYGGPILDLDNTFGALFIGVIVAGALWGVTTSQTFMYFRNYPEDTPYLKILVAVLWVCDTTHQALISHSAYTYLVTHFGQPLFLGQIVKLIKSFSSNKIEVVFNGLITALVQSFFAHRVWVLSQKNIILTGLVVLLIVSEFIMTMLYSARAFQFDTYAELTKVKGLSISINALAAAGDILIAASLCWMLQHSRTGFKTSDTMITKLIAFTINTGLLTSACAAASLITITTLPGTFIYILFFFSIGRCYCNSLLASLNARNMIRNSSRVEEYSMSLTSKQQADRSIGNVNRQQTQMTINVDTVRVQEYDCDQSSESVIPLPSMDF